MATAEELLRAVSNNVDKIFYIDFDTRTIKIPPSVKQLGVESDDDVKDITFSVPRYYYGKDLKEFNIYINYMNAQKEGDLFEVFSDKVREVDGNLEFDWTVGRHAVAFKGKVIFNVCMKKIPRDADGNALRDEEDNVIVEKEFNTTIAELPVLEGLETGEEIAEDYIDILMQWEEALFGAGRSVQRDIILKGSEIVKVVEDTGVEQQRQIVLKGSEVLDAVAGVKSEVTTEGEAQLRAIVLKGSEVTDTLTNLSIEQQRAITLKASEVNNALDTKKTDMLNDLEEVLPAEFEEYVDANPEKFKGPQGEKGDTGTSVTILGSYDSAEALKAAHQTGNLGDSYLVQGDLYVWSETLNDWDNVGTIQGPAGYTPQKGVDYFDGKDGENGYTPQKDIDYFDGEDGEDGVSPTVKIEKVGKVTNITITDATGTHTATINDGVDGTGAGDMLSSLYDTNGDGVVNKADDAAKLGGVAADKYALKTDIPEVAEKATDSDKLGGKAASEYALKTDIPTVSPLPPVTSDDNDKVLMVVDGEWDAVTIVNAEEVAY